MKTPKRRTGRETPPTPEKPIKEERRGRVSNILNQQKTTFLPSFRIEVVENKEATIEGCSGVLEYDENCIKLLCGKLTVRFIGHSLQIKALTADTAIVEGIISAIDFTT